MKQLRKTNNKLLQALHSQQDCNVYDKKIAINQMKNQAATSRSRRLSRNSLSIAATVSVILATTGSISRRTVASLPLTPRDMIRSILLRVGHLSHMNCNINRIGEIMVENKRTLNLRKRFSWQRNCDSARGWFCRRL
jgi:hypothetical protein